MPSKLVVETEFTVFENFDELPEEYKVLINNAEQAAENAYAPYSKFRVGAAILSQSGEITTGNNQENAAYPSGLCAERVALFHSFSQNPDLIVDTMAVLANKDGEIRAAMPCGACRQVIREYESKQGEDIKIIMPFKDGKYILVHNSKDLLPFSFSKDDL